jgi:hypothetical protein
MRPFLVAGKVWVDLDHVQEIFVPDDGDRFLLPREFIIRWRAAFRNENSVVIVNVPYAMVGTETDPDGDPSHAITSEAWQSLIAEHWQPFFNAWSAK